MLPAAPSPHSLLHSAHDPIPEANSAPPPFPAHRTAFCNRPTSAFANSRCGQHRKMASSQSLLMPLPNLGSRASSSTACWGGVVVKASGLNADGVLKAALGSLPRRRPESAHPARLRLGVGCSGLSAISNSESFTRSAHVMRFLAGRPVEGGQDKVVRLVVEAILNFFKAIWDFVFKGPALLLAKQLERKVDKATDVVEDAANLVISLTKAGRKVADTVEDGLEQVEKFATKVVEATEKIDDKMEDAVELLENAGELAAAEAAKEAVVAAALKEKTATVQQKSAELAAATIELKTASTELVQTVESSTSSVTSTKGS